MEFSSPLLDDSSDPTATHCLACAAPTGHTPACPASDPEATDLLVEQLPGDITRTWTVSGIAYNLTPARPVATSPRCRPCGGPATPAT